VALDEPWPSVYDADDLTKMIEELAARPDLAPAFYDWRADRSMTPVNDVCQGDIVELPAEVPVIGDDGAPIALEHPVGVWLVIGNTCDFDRSLEDARWTQLVPVVDLGGDDFSKAPALKRYMTSRAFYLPAWADGAVGRCCVADLLRPVAVDKRVFASGKAKVIARITRAAWVLLNVCLVRFLARDDGRYAS
jgi:hypothetical protein